MKKFTFTAGLLGASMMLTSCELVADIFEAGMAVGIILVVVVVALIFWLIRKLR